MLFHYSIFFAKLLFRSTSTLKKGNRERGMHVGCDVFWYIEILLVNPMCKFLLQPSRLVCDANCQPAAGNSH
ncbi:MAG TPA: hypothetical protein VF458_20775, partial [Ktedonobacteraceae bacterium]